MTEITEEMVGRAVQVMLHEGLAGRTWPEYARAVLEAATAEPEAPPAREEQTVLAITEEMVARGADALFDPLRAEFPDFSPSQGQRLGAIADADRVLRAALRSPVSAECSGEGDKRG